MNLGDNWLAELCLALDFVGLVRLVLVLVVVALVVVLIGICLHKIARRLGLGEDFKKLMLWPVIIAVVPVVVTEVYTKAISDAEIGVKYVEMGVGILGLNTEKSGAEECPKQGSHERIRKEWAVELINKNSPVPIEKAIAEALICISGRADIHEAPDKLNSTGTVR
jgi:hypothetical protein